MGKPPTLAAANAAAVFHRARSIKQEFSCGWNEAKLQQMPTILHFFAFVFIGLEDELM